MSSLSLIPILELNQSPSSSQSQWHACVPHLSVAVCSHRGSCVPGFCGLFLEVKLGNPEPQSGSPSLGVWAWITNGQGVWVSEGNLPVSRGWPSVLLRTGGRGHGEEERAV